MRSRAIVHIDGDALSAFPVDMISEMCEMLDALFRRGVDYCAIGVTLTGLRHEALLEQRDRQFSLFDDASEILRREEKRANVHRALDLITAKMGQETVFLGGSLEPSTGVEPATYPLPWGCSTTELRRRT